MKLPKYNARARRDLGNVLRNSYELFGTKQAGRYSDLLENAGLDLASGARKGQLVEGAYPERWSLRVGSHYLIYRHGSDGRVTILRILHSRMDLTRHL